MSRFTKNSVVVADVPTKPLNWLWQGWIPLGKISLLDGDPNLGKSLIAADIASRVSSGREMPDGTKGIKGDVELWCSEDDLEDTVRPRLQVAGANLRRIRYSNGAIGPLIERVKRNPAVKLLWIDPYS